VCRSVEKDAILLYTLRNKVEKGEQTIVFCATKYHVEYLYELAVKAGLKSTFIYGSMDQRAREEKLIDFRKKRVHFLFVTDLAARGIDIPMLENVVHYDFPTKIKMFIHRAGRTARAGKSGNCYAIITQEELAYMHDLSIFVGRDHINSISNETQLTDPAVMCYGSIPQPIIDDHCITV
jgi:ATP-dependent RNA helicase DDX54/DBP10